MIIYPDYAKILLKLQKGPKYDGYMTEKQMKELLKDKVDFQNKKNKERKY